MHAAAGAIRIYIGSFKSFCFGQEDLLDFIQLAFCIAKSNSLL